MTAPITTHATGVYDIPEDVYHSDPCPEPSLSSTIGKELIKCSPWHAWTAHPRLNPDFEPKNNTKFDLGRACHDLMLLGPQAFAVINAKDFKTDAAQEARDAAREAGKTPILAANLENAKKMVAAGREQIARLDEECDRLAFIPGEGTPEQTLIWREGPVWCRAKLDWNPRTPPVFHDYKTTAASAHPDAWQRTAYNMDADIQAGFYRRGIRALLGIENPEFRFVVQENYSPYALSVVVLTPGAIDMAERRAVAAINLWRRCMETGKWPGYPAHPCYIDPPAYAEARWIEREEREILARQNNVDTFKLAMDWQAPLEKAS